MATIQPRVIFTPSDTTGPLLDALSDALGKPKAKIVRELLDEAAPALQTALEALALIKTRPQAAQAAMGRLAAQQINQLSQAQLDLDTAIRKKPGPKPGKPRKGAAKPG